MRFARKIIIFCAINGLCLLNGCHFRHSEQLQGYVEGEYVYISSPLAGALRSLHVQRGAQVHAGDPLFELENTFEKAGRDQALAALTFSEGEFARQQRLSQLPGASSIQDIDRARSSRDQDGQRMVQAEWDYSQKRQIAPQASLVFDTLYREGEWVAAGHPVVILLPPENIKVRTFVPETIIGAIQVGKEARVMVDGISSPFSGKVSFISPRAEYTPPVIYSVENRGKLVFLVEIVFDPSVALKLHPGQPVDVQFNF